MKKLCKLLSVLLCVVMACACFIGCNTDATDAKAEELSYVSMRINPEIELVVDEEGIVVAVNAINEDGETVICQLELVGMTVEEAGEAFTAMATELGFIDLNAEQATVYILTEGENDEFVKEIEEKITEKINGFFDKKGIFGRVSPEQLEEFQALATEWGVSLKDARMISRILELYPEMTIEEILELNFEERIKLVKEDCVKNGLPHHLREEYSQAVEEIKQEYSKLFELAKEIKELSIQLKNQDLSEQELALIQQEYDAKIAEFETLKQEYELAIEQLKGEKRQKVEQVKDEIEQIAKNRRDQFAGKLKEHEDKFKQQKEEIEEQIRNWREKFN
ncbi:MAG: hypothetical protein II988_06420 [Clostridia bacterium]|nr:hypothetical protein [Clostridia bacterium]